MFGLLRCIRGIFGLVFAFQILHLVGAATLLLNTEANGVDFGKLFVILSIKVIVLAGAGFLFVWLRGLINRLHTKKHGSPHPALVDKKWAL